MGKNRRKRARTDPSSASTTVSAGWKSVSVELSSDSLPGKNAGLENEWCHDHNDGEDRELTEEYTSNHYDDPKLSRNAEKDLPMNRGEDCGMFAGLEVLDASQYRVEQKGSFKQLVMKGEEEAHHPASLNEKLKSKPQLSPMCPKNNKDEQEKRNADDVDEIQKKPSESKDSSISEPRKKKRKKKKTTKKDGEVPDQVKASTANLSSKTSQEQPQPISPEDLLETQLSWSSSSGGAHLHNKLIESVYRLGFSSPTPIQAATLAASIMGRRNLVGAAPTGSGKTLAFLLPILNSILEKNEEEENKHNDNDDDDDELTLMPKQLQALIVTPTRELATQIHTECEKLVPNQCVTLVGGIALVKQKRLLSTKKPPIIVATPGRLFAMLTSEDIDHLKDLSQIRFLVLDEADRMTQEHSFPELVKILDLINVSNPSEKDDIDDVDDDNADSGSDDGTRMLGLPGIRGEAHLTMLTDDILEQIQAQKDGTSPERVELPDDKYYDADDGKDVANEDDINEDVFSNLKPSVHRQTFIYSATLTLPFTSTKTSSFSNSKVKRRTKNLGLDGGIAEILDKTHAMGETKVVDLSSSSPATMSNANNLGTNGVRLPPGLSLVQIKCTQRHKDSHLYAYLKTTIQGASGPCLVFCNSIAAVRRVGSTFQTLGFSTRILHAHMQQRARFKAVESLKNTRKRVIVVCTDVAARGLDIPTVSTVVHYDVARAVDTFVHRSGRTARGMGKGAVGSSLSLISPAEDKAQRKIAGALSVPFGKVNLDGRLLSSSQVRVNLASKIYAVSEIEQKTNSSNRWFIEKAKEADLDLDDDLVEDESNMSEKELQQILEAKKARVHLARLLKEPLQTQKFGKFLSTNSAALQNQLKQEAS